jgi:PPOX class probable F420-dependent enzyme
MGRRQASDPHYPGLQSGRRRAALDPDDLRNTPAESRLREEVVVWLTTVSPDGQPQSTPVWFLWDGQSFLVYSQAGKPKLRNIAANPRVGLHLRGSSTGDDIVIVEGDAQLASGEPPADRVPDYIEKYREHIEAYDWTPESFAADYSEPIRIRPTRVQSW